MLAAPKYGFVYLATRKTGSTAIQNAFERTDSSSRTARRR